MGVTKYVLSTSQWWGGASLHVRTCTPSPCLRIRVANCAKIWCVTGDPIVRDLQESEVGWLHIRTCVCSFVVSETAESWHWSHTKNKLAYLFRARSFIAKHGVFLVVNGSYRRTWNGETFKVAISDFRRWGLDPEVSRNPFLNCPQIQLKSFRNRNQLNFLWFSHQMGHFFSKLMSSVLRHSCKCYFENFYTSHEKINDRIRAPSKSKTRHNFLSIFIFFLSFVTWPWPDLRWKLLKLASGDQACKTIKFHCQNYP